MSTLQHSKIAVFATLLLTICVWPLSKATAQETDTSSTFNVLRPADSKYELGFQSSFPTAGLSGSYSVNEGLSVQAVVDPLGNRQAYAGRVKYRAYVQEDFDVYGYGTIGARRYSFFGVVAETAMAYGGGAGIDLDLQRLLGGDDPGSFPPLSASAEAGFVVVDFDLAAYSATGFAFGLGLHYRF